MYKYWLIHCNKHTTPKQAVNNGGRERENIWKLSAKPKTFLKKSSLQVKVKQKHFKN